MSYTITYFQGSHRNVDKGQVWDFTTFEELADEFDKCAKGGKFSAYIVRGKLSPVRREDANLKNSNLLIVDADSGVGGDLCSPEVAHKALVDLGLNHFIYTTHSHGAVNKFRCVIASEDHSKDDLKSNVASLLKQMNDNGSNIKYVKEMGTWSQPWFVPTRDDPEDGLFEYYKYVEGKDWEITNVESSKTENAQTQEETGSPESLDQLYENVRTGKEFHESLRTISYQYVKDGMSSANAKAFIKMLLNGSVEAGSERWNQRYNDVDRLVDGAFKRVEAENVFDIPGDKAETEDKPSMPIPPGMLGELYNSAYNSLLYQYPEVALVSSLGVLSGITGRKYNIMEPAPSGLNLFLTIVAGTGFGKESISNFINQCIRGSTKGLKEHRSFIGPSNFTGPKAIVNSFMDARSRACVISEAGLMMKVKSGNVEGKTAFILDAFSSSHRDGYTKETSFSSKDDYVAEIRAMAITIVSESTEEHMIEAYRSSGALTDGHLPRQMIFKIDKRQTSINRNRKLSLPDNVAKRLGELMEICATVQSEDDPEPIEIFFDDDIREDLYDYITKYNVINAESNGVDPVRQNMSTRVAQKAVRLAALCSVFNNEKEVSKESWSWAKRLCDYEFDKVGNVLSGLAGNENMDQAIIAVYSKMGSIINDTIGNKKCQIAKKYRDKKIIPLSVLKIACDKNMNIKRLNDAGTGGKYKSGLDKVLEYLKDNGAIKLLTTDPLGSKSPLVIQLNEGILDFMKSYN